MNVLTFDPSSTATGWSLMPLSGRNLPVESGLLKRPSSWDLHVKLGGLHHDVSALMGRLSGSFDRIVIETPGATHREWAGKRTNSAPVYAMAVGVVIGCAWSAGVPVICVSADFWTKMGTSRCIPKERRLQGLIYSGAYDGKDDEGGDRGDAIGLGGWFTMRYGSVAAEDCPLLIPSPASGAVWSGINRGADGPVPKGARWTVATR